jgi:CDP-diacylglycerol--serine O-phosphatidyltransferase
MRLLRQIPNLMTLGNLFCGLAALVCVFSGEAEATALWMGAALLLDFGDGLAARLLRAEGELGKQLDSLADLLSFGVVPGAILARMILEAQGEALSWAGIGGAGFPWVLAAAALPLLSALRLARFNVDDRPRHFFYGVPTPISALLVLSLWMLRLGGQGGPLLLHPEPLALLSLLLALLLLAPLRLLSLKFQGWGWAKNAPRYLLLAFGAACLLGGGWAGVPPLFLGYLLSSLAWQRIGR